MGFKPGKDNLTELEVAGDTTILGNLKYRTKMIQGKADGYTMLTTESGCVVNQATGTTTPGDTVITLPPTAAGLIYTFIWHGAAGSGFHISPDASDKFTGSIIDIANGNVVTATNDGRGTDDKDLILDTGSKVGDHITLVADGQGGWAILDGLGSWAFES